MQYIIIFFSELSWPLWNSYISKQCTCLKCPLPAVTQAEPGITKRRMLWYALIVASVIYYCTITLLHFLLQYLTLIFLFVVVWIHMFHICSLNGSLSDTVILMPNYHHFVYLLIVKCQSQKEWKERNFNIMCHMHVAACHV